MTAKSGYFLITAVLITLLLTGCGSAPKRPDDAEPAPDLSTAPTLVLSPAQCDPLEIRSGSFNWNYKNEDETMTGGIACGPHPLDDETLSHTAVLTLPGGQEAVSVSCQFSCLTDPDQLTVQTWNFSDLGNSGAGEVSTVSYETWPSQLELEAGYVYEFTAVWNKEKLNENGFYGSADYVIATQPDTTQEN